MIDIDAKKTIADIQRAQAANLRVIAVTKPGGALGKAVIHVMTNLHRQAVVDTHVDTGALKSAHRMLYEERVGEAVGTIYIDPAAVNQYGQKPSLYGPTEHARGGAHEFYQRPIDEIGDRLLNEAAEIITRGFGG